MENPSHNEIALREIEPTLWRLTKIFLSQFWRLCLLMALLAPFLFLLHFLELVDNLTKFAKFIEPGAVSFNIIYYILIFLPLVYVLQCLLFRLTIGIRYADFTLVFVPEKNYHTPEYWSALFYVSWAYFWRTALVEIVLNFAEYRFPHFFENSTVSLFRFLLSIFIGIILLRFVVNQQYGNVRLSLVKREVEV